MSGIEQAFKDFVKRVSEQENQEQKSGERGFQYGGGAIGYADGGRINYAGGGSGLPPVEEDQSEQLLGQSPEIIPTRFNFGINKPSIYEEGQTPTSGGIKDLKKFTGSMMGNFNPFVSYMGNNSGANISAMINPAINSPTRYMAHAYSGPEQDRYHLNLSTAPSEKSKQMSVGYESPYGNFSLGASRDSMGRNYGANYNLNFADGGEVNTHLTRTIPPDSGPNPQGVETLFKRRYN
jgi:hypothetical protein